MNPNYNRDPNTGTTCPYSQSMDSHAVHVWNNHVLNSGYTEVYVVAHSAGGGCLSSIQMKFKDSFFK